MQVVLKFIIIIALFGMSTQSFSQEKEEKIKQNYFTFKDSIHSPKKATIYSAVLPGLGQAYNQKYWKIPIVYAAIGGCVAAAVVNHREFKVRFKELTFRNNNPGQTMNSQFDRFETSQLLEFSDFHRTWRDNMIIISCVAYALNIIDANVDAHLFNFNVDDDLSLSWSPYLYSQEFNQPVSGLSLRLNFR